jgi:hypothetical protein
MTKVVIAEYDAQENALRLAEPLAGIGDRPWLSMRGILSAEAGASLAAAIDEMFGSSE